ncbi:MAG: Calx-beta domain-containing protein [Chloroflexota bacterium]
MTKTLNGALSRVAIGLLSLLIALPLVPASPVLGQAAIGATLTVLKGTAAVVRSDGQAASPAASGTTLGVGDRVATLSASAALITFFDGSELELESETTVVLKEIGGGSNRRVNIGIENVLGSTVNRVAALTDPASSYRVEGGGTIALVRGTTFYHAVDSEGNVTVILTQGGPLCFPYFPATDSCTLLELGKASRGAIRTLTNRGEIRDGDLKNRDPWNTLVEENGAIHGEGLSVQGANTASRNQSQQPKRPGQDDEPLASTSAITLSIAGASLAEGDAGQANATFNVTLSGAGATSAPVTVAYSTADGTASAGSDYTATNGTLTFPPGPLPATLPVTVLVNGDLTVEPDETFTVTLSAPTNATISTATATGTILNDDSAGSVAFSSPAYSAPESAGTANITISRAPAAASASARAAGTVAAQGLSSLTVNFATSDGTATAPSDYAAVNGAITFGPGETTKTIPIQIVNDTLVEGNETLTLTLSGPSLPSPITAVLTIVDDDATSTIQFSANTYAVNETGGSAAIAIVRSGGLNNPASVTFATANGTATSPADYTATSTTVNFAAGESAKLVSVPIVDDTLPEGNETISLALSAPVGAVIGAQPNATLTIIDDDTFPSVQLSSATYTVGEAGGTVTITATRAGLTTGTSTMAYATSNGTAASPADYTATSGTLSFAVGETSKTFTVPIINDDFIEGNKTFNVALSAPSGATLGTPVAAVVTITEDDTTPSLQFSAATYSVGEAAGTATITVTRTGATGPAVGVTYAASAGTATTPADFTAASNTLSFASGEISKTFNVTITDDALDENNETVNLGLSAPTGGAVLAAQSTAVLTIVDDDPTPSLSINDQSITEGDPPNTGTMTFTITLSAASGRPVTVDYKTTDGTGLTGATAPADYTAIPLTTVTFAPGETTKPVNVTIIGDFVDEGNETFTVDLSNPTNATISDGQGTGTILDDDLTIGLSQPVGEAE